MKGFCSNQAVKVIATLLAIVLSGLCATSVGAVIYMYIEGYYDSNVSSFYDTRMFYNTTRSYAENAYNHWKDNSRPMGKDESYFSEDNSNFAYTISHTKLPDEIISYNYEPSGTVRELSYEFSYQTVHCYVQDPIVKNDGYYEGYWLFQGLYPNRINLIIGAGACILIVVTALAILIAGAGRRKGVDGIVLRGQDKIPFDLYLVAGFAAEGALLAFALNTLFYLDYWGWIFAGWIAMVLACIGIAMLVSVAARFKAGGWWRNTVLLQLFRLGRRAARALWGMTVTLIKAMPLIWKVLIGFCIVTFVNYLFCYAAFNYYSVAALFFSLLFNLVLFAALGFAALNMQRLKQAGEQLAQGDFEQRVDKQWMVLDFLQHAKNLDSIGDGMAIAVQQRMKSERLKTELITNVSHDIKTPLTSIINYVDLLKKESLPAQAAEYATVLEKHAARLKKLTEDVVEASKASTGNLPVMLQQTDLCELVGQALGEYNERLEEHRLEPVASIPTEELFVMADGKLLWRVMDNLLGNIFKYGQPCTRVYIDVQKQENQAVVTLKNISQNRLNMDANELIERFVRGDSSRVTEGSGLGLNIAQSLVELQKGHFGLAIDGDLFKAEMRFPIADLPVSTLVSPQAGNKA